ncbi:MAG: hypothetical protein GX934_10045 [Burkholderiales bacterium]|nr:hypothetical protein [Burkholderiales bacterium]
MSPAFLLVVQLILGGTGLIGLLWFWKAARQRRFAALPLGILLLSLVLAIVASGWRNRALLALECADGLQSLGLAMELYAQNHQGTPAHTLDDLLPFYFDELPVCSLEDGSVPTLERSESNFTLVCAGRHRGLGGTPEGFPRYTPSLGVQVRP